MTRDLREQLAAASEAASHWLLFHEIGCPCPPTNYLGVPDTFKRFSRELLPLSPITDPRGKVIRIRKDNFPKFLNLQLRPGYRPKKPSTIAEHIEQGRFEPAEYTWAKDRIQTLFWVPNLIQDPDAIYRKRIGWGLIPATEVYVKVDNKAGSKIKLLFVDYFGKSSHPVFITSFLTDEKTGKKHCDGPPLYRRK